MKCDMCTAMCNFSYITYPIKQSCPLIFATIFQLLRAPTYLTYNLSSTKEKYKKW
jgi:hypothetical protein